MSMWDAYGRKIGEERVKIDDIPTEETKNDNVNHPSHYQGVGGLEASDVIKAFTADLTGYDAFCAGNAIKYILRWHKKNGTEDLEKARWYVDELIKRRKVTTKDLDKENAYAYTE